MNSNILKRKSLGLLISSALLGGLTPSLFADTLEERVARLEAQANSGGGLPSWLSIKGELEYEYKDPEQDSSLPATNSHARFDVDKYVLGLTVKLSDNLKWVTEFQGDEGTFFFEEGYAQFGGLPGNTWMKIGLFERFTKASGKFGMGKYFTETYPMAGTSNWRDDEYQVQLGGTVDNVFWRALVGDGLEITDKGVGEDDGASGNFRSEILHDNDMGTDGAQEGDKLEWGVGLGYTVNLNDDYKFDVSGWHFESELNLDEKTFLFAVTGLTSSKHQAAAGTDTNADFTLAKEALSDRQRRSGFRSTHVYKKDTRAMYEVWESVDARFRRKGWYLDVAHKVKFDDPLIGGEFVKDITPNVRYEEYNTNAWNVFGDPRTWDRTQTVYAILIGITANKNLKSLLKLEYLDNKERTGHTAGPIAGGAFFNAARIKNDEFLAQLELKF